MIRRPPRSTLFPTRRSSDLSRAGREGDARSQRYQNRRRNLQAVTPGGNSKCHPAASSRSEEHTSELQSRRDLVCRLLLEKKKKKKKKHNMNKQREKKQDQES